MQFSPHLGWLQQVHSAAPPSLGHTLPFASFFLSNSQTSEEEAVPGSYSPSFIKVCSVSAESKWNIHVQAQSMNEYSITAEPHRFMFVWFGWLVWFWTCNLNTNQFVSVKCCWVFKQLLSLKIQKRVLNNSAHPEYQVILCSIDWLPVVLNANEICKVDGHVMPCTLWWGETTTLSQ